MENAAEDRPENTTEHPKSWIAWKRRAERAETEVVALEARCMLNAMQQWRDADHADIFTLTRSDVITLIEGVRVIDGQALGEERADALRRVVEQCCRAENQERLFRSTLQSIANSKCCSGCQEAALVAKSVL